MAIGRANSTLTDEELVEKLKGGDRTAGDLLVGRHNRLVAQAVYQVVNDLAAVEDLIQDIFMKAFRKVHLYKPELGKFTVWLVTVSRHEAINYLRRTKRSHLVSLEDTAPEGGFSPIDRPSEQVSKKETWGKILVLVNELAEPARTILKKRMLEGKPFDEIASLLKQPLDTVKTIYYRNTEVLRKKMAIPGL
jgi:RNA polymerase sigma-70 factor (ECF subfamily)